jgi:hypothetical protein
MSGADVLNGALSAPPTLATITILGSGRVGPTITALVGLAAAGLAARTLAQRRRPGAPGPSTASAHRPTPSWLGAIAVLLGGVFLASADSGPGTGDGVVGSAAALVLGVLAIALDRLAATRAASSQ